MKLIKKLLILLGAIIVLSGCSRSVFHPIDPVTIEIWHYYTSSLQTVFEEAISVFNNTVGIEKGIQLQPVYQEDIDVLTEKIIDSSKNKVGEDDLPDMIFAYTGTVLELDKLGLIANMEPYFSKNELSEYLPSYIEEGKIGDTNQLKSFPIAKSTEIIYINNNDYTTFKNAVNHSDKYPHFGDDQLNTCEGIMEIADIYFNWTDDQTPEIIGDGKAFIGFDATPNYISIGARQLSGPTVVIEKGKPKFSLDESTAKTLWNYYYYGILTGRFAEIGRYRADDMKTGDLIAYIGSSGGARYFPLEIMLGSEHTYNTELVVSKYPVFQGSKKVAIQQGAGISIIKSTKSKEAACAEFLKWFTSPEQNVKFSYASGYSPVKKAEYVNELEEDNRKLLVNEKNVISKNIATVLELASIQMNEYELSVDKEYPGSFDVRNMLGVTLSEQAKSARKNFLEELSLGHDYNALVKKYMDEKIFKEWYTLIKSEFEKLTN